MHQCVCVCTSDSVLFYRKFYLYLANDALPMQHAARYMYIICKLFTVLFTTVYNTASIVLLTHTAASIVLLTHTNNVLHVHMHRYNMYKIPSSLLSACKYA